VPCGDAARHGFAEKPDRMAEDGMISVEERTYGLNDMLAVMRRRKSKFWITFGALLLLSLIVTFSWPATYRSTGTILITQEEIPSELVPSTISGYAEQQIRGIEQRVMTSKNLLDIIDKFGLYKDDRDRLPRTDLVDMAREKVTLEMVSAEVVDPRNGRAQEATIAFTLSFDDSSPRVSQQVTNELVSLFLNENVRRRISVTRDTAEFMGQQADELNKQILELEEQLARFKQQNGGALPYEYTATVQVMQRTQIDLAETERTLSALQDRRVELESELAQTARDAPVKLDGSTVLAPMDQLRALRSQYSSLVALYGESHPDVVRLKRQIEGLEQSTGATSTDPALDTRLQAAKSELASARERYTDDHPEVQRLEREVAGLEAQKAAAPATPAAGTSTSAATNPNFVQLQIRLQSTIADMQTLTAKRETLRQAVNTYSAAIAKAPEAERVYTALTRQLDDARARHKEITEKQMEAELSRQVEQSRKGERFELVEPPVEPTTPYSPNRLAWLFLGLLLSVAGAIGAVAVAESLDGAVRGSESITAMLGAAPLAMIPYIMADGEGNTVDRNKVVLVGVVTVSVLIVILALVHFLYKPLDVLWYILMRRLGI
jgi:uncharacterized protein involved in exopolysaccharide biosynthesis